MGLIETFAEKAIASGAYQPLDKVYVANKVRALVGDQDGDVQAGRSIAEQLVDLSIENGKIEDGQTEREILNEQLFDLLTPTPSAVNARFWQEYQRSPEAATGWFYQLCTENDYVKVAAIKKNVEFTRQVKDGNELEITINLSKPEKDPKAIACGRLRCSRGCWRSSRRG